MYNIESSLLIKIRNLHMKGNKRDGYDTETVSRRY